MIRILRQPRRKDGPGRARTDDDGVVFVGDFGSPLGGDLLTNAYARVRQRRAYAVSRSEDSFVRDFRKRLLY